MNFGSQEKNINRINELKSIDCSRQTLKIKLQINI